MANFNVSFSLIIQDSRKHRIRSQAVNMNIEAIDSETARKYAIYRLIDNVDLRRVKRLIPTRILVIQT